MRRVITTVGFALFVFIAQQPKCVYTADPVDFSSLIGGYIVAEDGHYLGKIITNEFDSKSILNTVGKHGSSVSSESIFNSVGMYGSSVSSQSPFNSVTSTPPRVYTKDGEFVGFLSVNTIKTPRIDPYALIGWLQSQK